jgi:hypothetical protein
MMSAIVVDSGTAMDSHAPTSAFPPPRHLALTTGCVLALHLLLLGAPPSALGHAVNATDATTATQLATPPTPAQLAESAPAPVPRTGLTLRLMKPDPIQGHEEPVKPPVPASEALWVSAEPSAPTPADTWTIAQLSTDSEQLLRQNSSKGVASVPAKVPGAARMQFDVLGKIKGFGYTVSGELNWQQDGRQYQARFEIGMPLLGSRVQTSQGQLGAGGLMPTRFGDKVRSEQAAHFEREKGLVSFSANTPSAPLEPGAQDRLSLFFQLASLLAGAPERYATGTQITLQTVSAREAEPWTFRVDAAETLQLPLGPVSAIRLTRLPRQPYDQQVDLWFAPSLGYLPVRLRVTHPNGDVADQVLRRLDPPA